MAKKQTVRSHLRALFRSMRRRCYDEHCRHYKYYGGRGIRICDEWLSSPSAFVDWALSAGYALGLSIDRIDPDGHYSPENCQWLPFRENCFAKRKYVERKSKTRKLDMTQVQYIHAHPELSPSALAAMFGVNRRTIWNVRSGATWVELHPKFGPSAEGDGHPCRKRLSWKGDYVEASPMLIELERLRNLLRGE